MANKKKRKRKNSNYQVKKNLWGIPKGAEKYFDPHYDDKFKKKHPILYALTVVVILILVCVGPFIYFFGCAKLDIQFDSPYSIVNVIKFVVWVLGLVSSIGISIGLNNVFMILHRQYLGHFVTLISIAIGIVGIPLSLFILNIL